MKNLVKFQKREIDRKIKGWGLVFRKIFRPVIADQESRFLQRLPLLDKPTLRRIMDVDYENKVVALAMRPVYITAATEEAEIFLGRVGIFVKSVRPALLLDEKIFKYADKYSFAMAKYVNKTTSRRIRGEILSGLRKKITWSKIATNIKKNVFKDLAQGYRSRMIARTEAHGMVENGSYEAAKASKIMKEKTWSSGADARPTHTDAHNQTVLLSDHFYVGGYLMDFPGDTSLGASMVEIIHCRCSVGYSSKIHKKRLTTSKELRARYEEQKRIPLKISDANLEQLQGEAKLNSMLFDQRNTLESAAMTKQRITNELYKKLKNNKDFMKYIENSFDPKRRAMLQGHKYKMVWLDAKKDRAMDTITHYLKNWSATSGDESYQAIAMQIAAQKEFHLAESVLSHFAKIDLKEALIVFQKRGKAMQAFLRAQYNLTQEFFKKNGITHLTGYRGIRYVKKVPGYKFGEDIKVASGKLQLQPLSSFSTDSKVATNFAELGYGDYRMLIQTNTPINRILSTCQTGFGCKIETEFIILGGEDIFKIATSKQFFINPLNAFVDFKVPVPKISIPKWKPTMTTKEADVWAKGSTYADDVFYHGTSKKAADSIETKGFDIKALGVQTNNGGFYGAGHYVAPGKDWAIGYGDELLKLKVNIKNPLTKLKVYEKLSNISSNLSEIAKGYGDLSFSELKRKLTTPRYITALKHIDEKDWRAISEITRVEKFSRERVQSYIIQKAGYDGVRVGYGNELVIFNDNALTVIK